MASMNRYAGRPIPILNPTILPTVQRAEIPVNMDDPRAHEALVDVRTLGVEGDNFYARKDGSNPPYGTCIEGAIDGLLLRKSAAERLVTADAILTGFGVRLYVLDGYRPISTQRGLWKFFWRHFAVTEPSLTERELETKTLTFVSDPRAFHPANARTWPLHSTGGAVDTTLIDDADTPLDLGTPFDDASEASATAFFEIALSRREVSDDDPRLLSRRLLYWAMREAGFTNYLNEWWHYDWGNQMHVLTLRMLGEASVPDAAWYGYTEPAPAGMQA